MKKIKILVADDHALLRVGLNTMLNTQPDMVVVGEASNGGALTDLPRAGSNLFEVVATTGIPTTGTTNTTKTTISMSSAEPSVVDSREKPMQRNIMVGRDKS